LDELELEPADDGVVDAEEVDADLVDVLVAEVERWVDSGASIRY
jgi:hypothetical protein